MDSEKFYTSPFRLEGGYPMYFNDAYTSVRKYKRSTRTRDIFETIHEGSDRMIMIKSKTKATLFFVSATLFSTSNKGSISNDRVMLQDVEEVEVNLTIDSVIQSSARCEANEFYSELINMCERVKMHNSKIILSQ